MSTGNARGGRVWQGLAAAVLVVALAASALVLMPRGPLAGDVPRASDAAAAPTSPPATPAPASQTPSPSTASPTTTSAPSPSPARTVAPSVSPEASRTPGVPPIYGPEFGEGFPEAPPPVTVRAGDTTFGLRAWSYCYMDGCPTTAAVSGRTSIDPVASGSVATEAIDSRMWVLPRRWRRSSRSSMKGTASPPWS